VQKIGAARDTAVGLAGGAGGYSGMIATSPACVGIVTCTVPAALGTLGTLSLQDAWESAKGITAEFKPSEPQRVADSFQLGTFSGDESATTELLKDAAIVGAGATALGAAERAYRKVAGGFTVGAKGLSSVKHASGVELPKSQAQMIANFETAGYPSKPVVSPTSGNVVGTQYTLPDGSRVRVMQADGRSPQRASFENANGGPIDPTTGKPPQPPKGLSKAERKQWIRERTNIEQVD